MKMIDQIYEQTLSNGIRVVHKYQPHSKIFHGGFVIDIGSRDERKNEFGIAHFWEHMAFKGTSKRKSYHIMNRLEAVGGDLNAYTTKEKIYFHASILDIHTDRAIDLLTDITFNSIFPENEIKKEKKVIIEEMAMYEDSPEELILDDFENMVFAKHALGHYILGDKNSVNKMQQADFFEFLNRNLYANKVVFSSVGNMSIDKVVYYLEKSFESIEVKKNNRKKPRKPFELYKPNSLVVEKDLSQAHYIMGKHAYDIYDNNRYPFFMMTHLLGGMNMTSRLNLALREKRGYVYAIEASYTPYTDTGLFYIYFGTEKKQLGKCLDLVSKEINDLMTKKISQSKLVSIKEQLKSNIAMAEENSISVMQVLGRSLLDFGKIDSIATIYDKIDKISSNDIVEVSRLFFEKNDMSSLIFMPQE